MRKGKIVLAFLRNRRTSLTIFLPILFLGIVLSSTPVISVANVGVIVNFLFQRAYPIDAYALINLSFQKASYFSYSSSFSLNGSKFVIEISGIRFLGSIKKEQNKIWENASTRIYRFGELDLGGIGVLILKNSTSATPLTVFFLGPKSGEVILGKEVNSPQLIFPQPIKATGIYSINFSAGVLSWKISPKELFKRLTGVSWKVSNLSFEVKGGYFPGCGKYPKISYIKLNYFGQLLFRSHMIQIKERYHGKEITLKLPYYASNWAFLVLPRKEFSEISSFGAEKRPIIIEAKGGKILGDFYSSHLALFIFGVSPKDFINKLYPGKTFEKKLSEEVNATEKIFLKAAFGIPIISWKGISPPPLSSFLGKTVLLHSPELREDAISYLTTEYISEVLTGNYIITAAFIFTFPLLLLVSLVILTTVLENSAERAKGWIRTMIRRGIPPREIGSSLFLYCIVLGILGAFSGIFFSGIALPRIISIMLSLPITTSPSYYFTNYFLYVFSIPATVIVSLFSVRRLSKGIGKIPLVGIIPGVAKGSLRLSKATLAISIIALYGVLTWYFRISPEQVLSSVSSPMISALYIMSLIVSFPFLMISPLLVPRFFSILSFISIEKMSKKLERIAEIFSGELGKLGFNSSKLNLDRIKIMGYSLTLALSTTFGMIMIKGALPGILKALSAKYAGMLGVFFYVFKAIEMFLSMISIFSFAIGIVGTYGCILEMIDEVRPQLVVARARGAGSKDIVKIAYGTLLPYLLYASLVSIGVGFSLMISVDALLAVLGAGQVKIPHLIPAFDPFLGMYFAYLALIFLAPYLVTRTLVGRKLGEELRRVWS